MNGKILSNRIFTGKYLVFLFYLFMLVCGFVAGTRIWPQSISFNLSFQEVLTHKITDIMAILVLPPTVIMVIICIMALFAGGWLLLPVIVYSAGVVSGYIGCAIFSDAILHSNIGILLSFAFSYFCSLAVISYACVYSHNLSRVLSCGGNCRSAYKGHAKSTVISFFLIVITSFIFSVLIYCLFSFVKH